MATAEEYATALATRSDLRRVYLHAFDQFAIVSADIPVEFPDINHRYARELTGILLNQGLLVETNVNGDEDVLQTDPTSDETSHETAEQVIDEWLNKAIPLPDYTPASPKPKKGSTKMTATATKTTPESTDFRKCGCGCNENVNGKSNYKPGHDARHAGQVARAIIADPSRESALLATLPSVALQTKASNMVTLWSEKAAKKAEKKVAKVKAEWEDLEPVKIGRWTYPTRKNTKTNVVQRNQKKDGSGEWVDLDD